MAERSAVQFGLTPIAYTIVRSRRRRTVAIAIDPTEGVVVTSPATTPVAKLDQVVLRKGAWIAERLRRVSSLPPPPAAKEFVSGDTFVYLGRHARLKVQPSQGNAPEVRLARGWLVVSLPKGHDARKAVVGWYREHAAKHLAKRVAEWAGRIGVAEPPLLVRSQRKRWASCDAGGVLRFNWRIIQAPMPLVDYVVAHELVHLIHPDHTREFWRRLGRAMPDYETRKARLKELGRALEW